MASTIPDEMLGPVPTSGSNGVSVFADVVQAPEDPILGVRTERISNQCFLWFFLIFFSHDFGVICIVWLGHRGVQQGSVSDEGEFGCWGVSDWGEISEDLAMLLRLFFGLWFYFWLFWWAVLLFLECLKIHRKGNRLFWMWSGEPSRCWWMIGMIFAI